MKKYKNLDWDRDIIHGGHPDFEYIGRRSYLRDGRMLKFLAPHLQAAYGKRKERHLAPVRTLQLRVIDLLHTLIARLVG